MAVEDFFKVIEIFNDVFNKKMRNLNLCLQFMSSEGRMIDFGFSVESGYHTPNSNQVVLGLVQRKQDFVQIQVQQGPLIIATADLNFENFEEDPICGLTLQTNSLSMFNVYSLHVLKHEPNHFFQKCGYGRLSFYFALLYSVSTGMMIVRRDDREHHQANKSYIHPQDPYGSRVEERSPIGMQDSIEKKHIC